MDNFPWTCPYCNRDTTITEENFSKDTHYFDKSNKEGFLELVTTVVTCPNLECRDYSIYAGLYKAESSPYNHAIGEPILEWLLKPKSNAKQFPINIVPEAIIADYEEACLILDQSPKASATLSRRCLQGIIRDFWKVRKRTLKQEIDAIQEKTDPITWEAINSVREIGNIGAHMENDVNLIIDIEPNEAQLLIGLIEILIKDWYITREERKKSKESVIALAKNKSEEKASKKKKEMSDNNDVQS